MSPIAPAVEPVTLADLKPLLGCDVIVETDAGTFEAHLLSCVRDSAWFIADEDDLVLHLPQILRIKTR